MKHDMNHHQHNAHTANNKTETNEHMNHTAPKTSILATVLITLLGSVAIIFITMPYGHSQPSSGTNGHSMHTMGGNLAQQGELRDTRTTEGLQEAQPQQEVILKDGDSYTITVTPVKKVINGVAHRMLAYNGSIPGPRIVVAQGATVYVTLDNQVPGLETTIHSHGVRVKNAFDGVAGQGSGTQPAVTYGQTFRYELTFPDAGNFWYHPHVREDLQQELGLYGSFLVQPKDEIYGSKADQEEFLMLDDILIENNKINLDKNLGDRSLMGRFGNVFLVNGQTTYNITTSKNKTLRLHFTNVSNTRVYNLTIPGATIKIVGGDNGEYEQANETDSLLIAPAERYTVDVIFDKSGEYTLLHSIPGAVSNTKLATISVTEEGEAMQTDNVNSGPEQSTDQSNDLADLVDRYFEQSPDKKLRLAVDLSGDLATMNNTMGSMGHGNIMHDSLPIEREDTMPAMNIASTPGNTFRDLIDEETKKENMDIQREFNKGDYVKISIFNDGESDHPMQHPVHFHGQRFVMLSRDGVKNTNELVWKDTVLVKTGETVDILLEATNPGTWMAHCHIAEHLTAGMMMSYVVSNE